MKNLTSSHGLDEVNVSFLPPNSAGKDKSPVNTLPLIISPRWDSSLDFLCKFMEENRSWLDNKVLEYGAVLIRGFDVESCPDFEKAVSSFEPELCDSYRGTSPRILMEGTKYVFSAAEVPVNYPIAQHCEMSFLPAPPRKLFFGCIKASTRGGGETALCDFRKVYQDISPELRHKILTRKIKYSRTHHKIGEYFTYDVAAMLGWPELFDTSDPKEVERICREEGAPPIRWTGPNGDTCFQEWVDEPCQYHPVTNEPVWFNHTQVFHWTTFPAELWYAFCRIKEFRLFLHFLVVSIFSLIKYGLLGYKMSLYSSFGDDTPISVKEMAEIRAAIHKNLVFSRWQRGDIMCIDNFSISHGRQPTYDKGRKIVVSWSEPFNKTNSLTWSSLSKKESSSILQEPQKGHLPGLIAATPGSSPESTLTSSDAQELKETFVTKRFEKQSGNINKCCNSQEDTLRKNLQEQIAEIKAASSARKRRFSWPPKDKGAAVLLHADSDFWKEAE